MKNTFAKSIKILPIYFLAILVPAFCVGQQAGVLDLTFSNDGIQTTAIGNLTDRSYAIAIQTDGKIVVAGTTEIEGVDETNEIAIARYLGAPSSVGIDKMDDSDFIATSVFPNPFQHTATLKVVGISPINATFLIYNSLGQLVHTQAISSFETALQSELPGGIYTYTIINETNQVKAAGKLALQ